MENEAIAVQILETTQRIDRCLRSEAPGLRSRRVEPPQLLLEDLHACLNWLCDELEGRRDALGSARSEPVLPKVAGGFLELIEGLDAVFWLADVETSRLLYVSRGCAAIWGRSAAELREQPHGLEAGIHPEDRERLLRGSPAGLRRGPARDESCRILRPDGLVRHARIRTLPLMDGRGGCGRVAGIAEDITARQEAEEQVQKDRAELRALASELVLTEERERRKLATDLHDGSQQALELARIKLGVLMGANVGHDFGSALKEIGALLEQSLEALRSLTFELSPPVLHDLGLVPALQWLAEDLERRLDLEVVVADDGRAKPLEERIRVLLFRSTRELLLNVAKHARVGRALVSLRREGQTLVLAVNDEGTGFDPEKLRSASQGGGYGLFSIRQRLKEATVDALFFDADIGEPTRDLAAELEQLRIAVHGTPSGADPASQDELGYPLVPKLPVILASSDPSDRETARAIGLEPAAFLQKPFTVELLIRTVRSVMSGGGKGGASG